MENYIFWSEIGSGFGERGGTPPPRIPWGTPPPPGSVLFICFNTLSNSDWKDWCHKNTKKKKKNEIIKLSQRRLSKLKEGFVGLLQFFKKWRVFWRFKEAIVYNCFWDLDLVGYVVEGKQNFGSAPWKIRKTNIILRIKCKNASTLLRRTNEKQIYNEKKEWKIYGWINDLLINTYMYTNNWNFFVFHTIDKSQTWQHPSIIRIIWNISVLGQSDL